MPAIKQLSSIASKYSRVTPERATDYALGIANPRVDWATATAAAAAVYKSAVIAAANEGRFEKGVTAAGTPKWKARATAVGPNRFAEGVALAGPDYSKGFAPYHAIIAGMNLPPRYPKGDKRNIDRVAILAAALHAAKIGK
jgi:hypothetical protein